MLIPLTDPEHPLAKQMIRLIGDHSHLPKPIDASIEAAPSPTPPSTPTIRTTSGPDADGPSALVWPRNATGRS